MLLHFANSQKFVVNQITFCKTSEKSLQNTYEVHHETYTSFKEFYGQCLTVVFSGFVFILALSGFIIRKCDFIIFLAGLI